MPKNRIIALRAFILFAFLCIAAFVVTPTYAQDSDVGVDILPAKSFTGDSLYVDSNHTTHPPIRLTPDKSELIKLEKEAGTVIVGNPAHLSVLADSATTLVLVPKIPGATHITIIDRRGEPLMQRHVIVASPKDKYIRIRQSCAGSDDTECRQTQVYYCPDMCHEIAVSSGDETAEGNNLADMLEGLAQVADGANGELSESDGDQ